jgi:threonine/homoserine/homoserine lactone efflux protein
MELLSPFAIAFASSFVGTIPPGTLSLTIIQLGLNNQIRVAWRMAFAAAMIEYPYAWIAVEFDHFISRSLNMKDHFHLLSGSVMILLGVLTLWASVKPSKISKRFQSSGFRKGMLLAILNPLAIPFWIAMTAYLRSQQWVDLSDGLEVQAYLFGVSAGTLALFMLLAYLSKKVVSQYETTALLHKTPGVLLVVLGLYSFTEYTFG